MTRYDHSAGRSPGTGISEDENGYPVVGWKIQARFQPLNKDIKPEMVERIGHVCEWSFAGTSNDDEPYPGQWRWQACREWGGLWAPDEDLELVS